MDSILLKADSNFRKPDSKSPEVDSIIVKPDSNSLKWISYLHDYNDKSTIKRSFPTE